MYRESEFGCAYTTSTRGLQWSLAGVMKRITVERTWLLVGASAFALTLAAAPLSLGSSGIPTWSTAAAAGGGGGGNGGGGNGGGGGGHGQGHGRGGVDGSDDSIGYAGVGQGVGRGGAPGQAGKGGSASAGGKGKGKGSGTGVSTSVSTTGVTTTSSHGKLGSALGNLNAAHASETARSHAAPNSMVGQIAAYEREMQAAIDSYNAATLGNNTTAQQASLAAMAAAVQGLAAVANKDVTDDVVRSVNDLLGIDPVDAGTSSFGTTGTP